MKIFLSRLKPAFLIHGIIVNDSEMNAPMVKAVKEGVVNRKNKEGEIFATPFSML